MRRLPFEVANEKLLPLEFLMPIKYADAAAAAAEDAVPRHGPARLLANPRGQLTLTLGKCVAEPAARLRLENPQMKVHNKIRWLSFCLPLPSPSSSPSILTPPAAPSIFDLAASSGV